MNPEDAKCLLMQISRAEETDENKELAEIIVKVYLMIIFYDIWLKANNLNI